MYDWYREGLERALLKITKSNYHFLFYHNHSTYCNSDCKRLFSYIPVEKKTLEVAQLVAQTMRDY
jgi:hypothetical protein